MLLAGFAYRSVTSVTFSLTASGSGDAGEPRAERFSTGIAPPVAALAPAPGVVPPRLCQEPPILDLRDRHGSPGRWSTRLLTLGLWAGGAWLMGVPLSAGLALVALPVLLRSRRRPGAALAVPTAPVAPEDLPRQALAEAFGLGEATLFRARHSRSTTIHYNDQGAIVAIDPVQPGASLKVTGPRWRSGQHAHPVG